jgi:DNA primase large subunit
LSEFENGNFRGTVDLRNRVLEEGFVRLHKDLFIFLNGRYIVFH